MQQLRNWLYAAACLLILFNTAAWAEVAWTVTPQAGPHGSILPSTPVGIPEGLPAFFTITPDDGYSVDQVTGCGPGSFNGTATNYTTAPIIADCTLEVTFRRSTWFVTPQAGPHGSISPSTPVGIPEGLPASFTITPDNGYSVDQVTGCGPGSFNGTATNYTTAPIIADCTLTVSFQETISGSDLDSDDIDDAWEELWFGSLTTADAKSDFDEDGYSDLQEYLNALAGQTDPAGAPYNPKEKNAPGGTGYQNPTAWLRAVKLLLNQ